MEQQQTTRQQKIARQIQRDIAEILQKELALAVKGLALLLKLIRRKSFQIPI